MSKDDKGYIVVETVGAFIPFMLLVVSILSLVNIITLQVRIHYALTQTAATLSMYCYVLEAIGVSDEIMTMDAKGGAFSETIGDVLRGIGSISGGGGASDASGIFDAVQEAAGNPEDMIRDFANYGLNELRNIASAKLAEPLLKRYLANANMSVDEYFRTLRVTEFNIADCVIVDSNGNVKLTASYEVEYTFGALRLPFTPTLSISQTAQTKAWLGGSGEGYK